MDLVLRKNNSEEFKLWSGVIEDETDLKIVAHRIIGAFKMTYGFESFMDIVLTVWIDDNEIVDGQINGAESLKEYLQGQADAHNERITGY
jgi:hypothetical protein